MIFQKEDFACSTYIYDINYTFTNTSEIHDKLVCATTEFMEKNRKC